MRRKRKNFFFLILSQIFLPHKNEIRKQIKKQKQKQKKSKKIKLIEEEEQKGEKQEKNKIEIDDSLPNDTTGISSDILSTLVKYEYKKTPPKKKKKIKIEKKKIHSFILKGSEKQSTETTRRHQDPITKICLQ